VNTLLEPATAVRSTSLVRNVRLAVEDADAHREKRSCAIPSSSR
jgi:hypothetical protein